MSKKRTRITTNCGNLSREQVEQAERTVESRNNKGGKKKEPEKSSD